MEAKRELSSSIISWAEIISFHVKAWYRVVLPCRLSSLWWTHFQWDRHLRWCQFFWKSALLFLLDLHWASCQVPQTCHRCTASPRGHKTIRVRFFTPPKKVHNLPFPSRQVQLIQSCLRRIVWRTTFKKSELRDSKDRERKIHSDIWDKLSLSTSWDSLIVYPFFSQPT